MANRNCRKPHVQTPGNWQAQKMNGILTASVMTSKHAGCLNHPKTYPKKPKHCGFVSTQQSEAQETSSPASLPETEAVNSTSDGLSQNLTAKDPCGSREKRYFSGLKALEPI